MLTTQNLIAFLAVALVIIVIPGPSVVFTIGRALVLGSGPAVLSEFGGVRVASGDPGWGYAQVDGGDAFLARYRALLAAVHRSALAGFCYTQLTDTFQEQNGLLTMDRRPKGDLAAFARATRGEEDPIG